MNIEMKVLGIDPNANFRHPQLGLNRFPEDGGELDWNDIVWLNGNGGVKPSWAELQSASYPAEYQKQMVLESIYAPFTYNGEVFGMTPDRQQVYDALIAKEARGKITRTPVIKLDGSLKKFGTPVELKAFLDAVDDEMQARLEAAYDALP